MSDRKRIQPRVDAALWERFRNDVKERKGQTRGVLGDELEKAIREYLRDDASPTERRLEKRLARIEEAVGAAPTDGGVDTFQPREHTHTRTATPTEKPAPNTATDKKIAWLAKCVREDYGGEFQEIPRSKLLNVIKDEYGFRRDTAKRYVDHLIEHFELKDHPMNNKILVTEERHEELIESKRERLKEEVDAGAHD